MFDSIYGEVVAITRLVVGDTNEVTACPTGLADRLKQPSHKSTQRFTNQPVAVWSVRVRGTNGEGVLGWGGGERRATHHPSLGYLNFLNFSRPLPAWGRRFGRPARISSYIFSMCLKDATWFIGCGQKRGGGVASCWGLAVLG